VFIFRWARRMSRWTGRRTPTAATSQAAFWQKTKSSSGLNLAWPSAWPRLAV